MKIKVLVVLLVVVVIALAGLLGMKIFMSKETNEIASSNNNNLNTDEPLTVVLDDKSEKKSKYDNNNRTIAVMIDNVGSAIPQTGLNDAMIVYEAIVEGGITRPYFIDYALENDSIYIHYGGSPKALDEVKSLGINNVNGIEVSNKIFWRTNKKTAPHNAIVSVEEAKKYISERGYRTTTKERNVLNYVADELELENEMPANTVKIPYSQSKVKFVYNADTKRYSRYVGNTLQKDWVTGEALTTKNIIVTFANNYTTDEENGYGRQALQNIGKDSVSGFEWK